MEAGKKSVLSFFTISFTFGVTHEGEDGVVSMSCLACPRQISVSCRARRGTRLHQALNRREFLSPQEPLALDRLSRNTVNPSRIDKGACCACIEARDSVKPSEMLARSSAAIPRRTRLHDSHFNSSVNIAYLALPHLTLEFRVVLSGSGSNRATGLQVSAGYAPPDMAW